MPLNVPLGPMPTTRRGRFLFYKARQRRRWKRLQQRHPSRGGPVNETPGAHPTSRAIDHSEATKQMQRSYPKRPVYSDNNGAETWGWRVRPQRCVFGVLDSPPTVYLTAGGFTHPHLPVIGYVEKRLKWLPRLKHLPRKPWRYTIDAVEAFNHYPESYVLYPSGMPNPWHVP